MRKLLSQEHRCICGKLLLKGVVFDGIIEIKCRRCGRINRIGDIKLVNDDTHYLLIINDKGIITNANNSSCNILGYSYEELIGKSITEINPVLTEEIGKRFYGPKSVLSEENYFKLDTVHRSKDGKNIPITAYLRLYRPTENGKSVIILAELKNKTRETAISKKDAPKFLDNACDFYFDLDKLGTIEYLSPSVQKIFRYSPEKILGKNYFDYLPAESKVKDLNTYKHFASENLPYRVKHNIGKDANGKLMHNQLYFTPKFNDSGKFVGFRVLGWVTKK